MNDLFVAKGPIISTDCAKLSIEKFTVSGILENTKMVISFTTWNDSVNHGK